MAMVATPFAYAQEATQAINFQTYAPKATATRIQGTQAPVIDGDLSDAVWAQAPVIDNFYQIEPVVGGKPRFRTEARILYDADYLYVAFRALDDEPDKIMRASMKRDGEIWKDDAVRITIDPQNTGRHGYTFEIGSGGVRWDALVENNSNTISEWNTIWHGHSRVDAQGWSAEIAIPFKSISFDPSQSSWGMNMGRSIRRYDEPVRWANISNSVGYYDMGKAGRLEGLSGLSQGLGLDVQVLGTTNYVYQWDNPRQGDLTFEPSANLYYKITPSLTGTLTLNTDFSDAPLDARQVNTGRFGLFIPESRDFFLQDASLFEFGGNGLRNSQNGRPFFSRNIGITDFGVADIIAGGKLSGSIAGHNVAGLFVKTAGITGFTAEKTLGAARIARPIFGDSQIGAIFTFGDPSDDEDNYLGGFDVQLRNDTILPGRKLNADFYFARSSNDDIQGDAFGFEVASYEDDLAWWLNGKYLGENYDPALGFVNRTDFQRVYGGVRYRVRPKDSWIRFYQFETGGESIWSTNGDFEGRDVWGSTGLVTTRGDEFFMNVSSNLEVVPGAFNLPDGVLVPASRYDNWNVGLYAGSSRARWYAGNLNLDFGQIYGGDYFRAGITVDLRPSPYFSFEVRHDFQEFRLPGGSVRIHIDSARANINFTPDMTLTLQSEYDNISSEVGLSARYRWEFMPGHEVFGSLGHAANWEGRDFRSNTTTAGLRVGGTFRF